MVDRVEDRGLILLEISVVSLGQALQRREERDQISDDPAGLSAGQFGDVGIPFLRHQAAARAQGGRGPEECEFLGGPQDNLFSDRGQMHREK